MDDFVNIARTFWSKDLRLGGKQALQRALRAFDLA
jgi:hypothetical protein